MKKIIAIVLLAVTTTISFAQKNEIKALEKAIKSANFSDAKSAISSAEALIGNMDDKVKAKFYFLKAQALYGNGTGSDADIETAIKSLEDLKTLETSNGKPKYTEQANALITEMTNSFLAKANKAFTDKDYTAAANGFETVYKLSPKDTLYLYYAAASSITSKDYDKALGYYEKLKELGYTGIKINYYATNIETQEEELFNDKTLRDFSVKAKTHNNPQNKKSESKKAEIVRNIALIYVSQGKDEKALTAMADARAENPDDVGLLMSEANVHLKMGNRDQFKALMEEATEKDPDNPELFYNLGVLAAEGGNREKSVEYYNRAIELNPEYVDAYNNLAVVILQGEAAIVDEMNNLGNTAADNRRYDELKEKRTELYNSAIPYLEKSLNFQASNINAATTLMNIYSALGEVSKYKEMKAKVEAIEAAGNN